MSARTGLRSPTAPARRAALTALAVALCGPVAAGHAEPPVAPREQPRSVRVDLGTSGASVEVTRAEDGSHRLGETVLAEGYEHTDAASGNTYVFTQGPDGTWTAAYKPVEQSVPLGPAASLVLARAENGTWFAASGPVDAGHVVTAAGGASYRLALADGLWSAVFEPEQIPIAGTDLVALSTESGDGYRVGPGAVLPASGAGDVTVEGALYHVWRQDGGLHGARFDRAPHGTDAAGANFRIGLASGLPVLSGDDRETPANEDRTMLRVGGAEFPLGELLGTGQSTVRGRQIVRQARELIASLRVDAEALLAVLDGDRDAVRRMLERSWDRAQQALDGIFGKDKIPLRRELQPARALRAFDQLAAALASLPAFRAATGEDGRGRFPEAALTASEAAEAFAASEWEAQAVMGSAGDTRYGAVRKRVRPGGVAVADATLDPGAAADALREQLGLPDDGALPEHGAFAYSTIGDTHQSWQVPQDGTARYRGGTAAVSGSGTLYTGEIELLVRFRTQTVSGWITKLTDGRGRRWAYGRTGETVSQALLDRDSVEWISLPDMRLEAKADWSRQKRDTDMATIFYVPGGQPAEPVPATFEGHLVGRGGQAGSQAVGVWSVGRDQLDSTWMAGGFGAGRVATGPEPRPAADRGMSVETALVPEGAGGGPAAEIRDGILELRGTQYGAHLGTDDPDDEAAVVRNGGTVVQTHLLGLPELFDRQGSEQVHDGRAFVDIARAEIRRLRGALALSFPLFERTDMSFREPVWELIDEHIRYWLFGRGWLGAYPTRRGLADDRQALETIDKVLEALESPAALEAALKAYTDGVFVGQVGRPIREVDVREAWERVESRIRLWMGSTRYTRFGAWRKQTAVNAAAGYVDRLAGDEPDGNGPDAFAYSSLEQTAYSGDGDPRFPLGASASYSGETVAVQGRTFYTGAVDLRVRWRYAWDGAEAGRLTATVSGLRDDLGDWLTYDSGGTRPRFVHRMSIKDVAILVDGGRGRVRFADDDESQATILFGDRTASATPDGASIEGRFVGKSMDGPLGAIGLWTVVDGRFGNGERMRGAFGAELDP